MASEPQSPPNYTEVPTSEDGTSMTLDKKNITRPRFKYSSSIILLKRNNKMVKKEKTVNL